MEEETIKADNEIIKNRANEILNDPNATNFERMQAEHELNQLNTKGKVELVEGKAPDSPEQQAAQNRVVTREQQHNLSGLRSQVANRESAAD